MVTMRPSGAGAQYHSPLSRTVAPSGRGIAVSAAGGVIGGVGAAGDGAAGAGAGWTPVHAAARALSAAATITPRITEELRRRTPCLQDNPPPPGTAGPSHSRRCRDPP